MFTGKAMSMQSMLLALVMVSRVSRSGVLFLLSLSAVSRFSIIVVTVTADKADPCPKDCEDKTTLCIDYHVCVGGKTVLEFKDRCQIRKHLIENCCPVDESISNANSNARGCTFSQAFHDFWEAESVDKPGVRPGGKSETPDQTNACRKESEKKLTKYDCAADYVEKYKADVEAGNKSGGGYSGGGGNNNYQGGNQNNNYQGGNQNNNYQGGNKDPTSTSTTTSPSTEKTPAASSTETGGSTEDINTAMLSGTASAIVIYFLVGIWMGNGF